MEIKFTPEGKKVIVVGDLNSREKIVQEVFIIDGKEVPSGEHFTSTYLSDSIPVSWREKYQKEKEEEYQKKISEIEKLEGELSIKQKELRMRLDYVGKNLKNVSKDSFNTLIDFLTDNIKWLVFPDFTPRIEEWKNSRMTYEFGRELRLISLFGRDDGSLTYGLGRYSDYSGGYGVVIPFSNYDDAFNKFKELVLNSPIHENLILIAKEHKIELDPIKVKEWKEKEKKRIKVIVNELEERIKNNRNKLNDLD